MTELATITTYLTVPRAHGPTWSPSGTSLAFLSDQTGIDQVWLLPSLTSQPQQLTSFTDRVGLVSWSPDGSHLLATVDSGGNEHDQLYLLSTTGTAPLALTRSPHVIHHFGAWSPNGAALCYSSNQRHPAFFDVWTMDLQTQTTHCVLAQDASLLAEAWSNDARFLLVTRFNSETDLDLLLLSVEDGSSRLLTPHEGEATYMYPRFSPNDRSLYVLTNVQREFMAPARIELHDSPSSPTAHAPLTYLAETTWDAEAGLALSPDGTTLTWALNEDGCSRLVFYDLVQQTERPAPTFPPGVIEGLTGSPTGPQLAFSFNGTRHASNIWLVSPSSPLAQQATSLPAQLHAASLVVPERIHYPSFDGLSIPAYYYRPHTSTRATPDGRLPVIVFVHGGPESQFRPLHAAPWMPPFQYYLHQGFALLAPNVRGSTGYGKTYVHLDDVALRSQSVADLKAAVDWLIGEGHADPRRIGILGRSYGGYMVLAAITSYPDLWAAAVDIVGIANFVSFLEQTGPWRRKWREAEYGSLANDRETLINLSPIHAVERITSPLLVLHGANDSRVPVAEADHIVAAVKARGIPVDYLRFADEGHFMLRQSTQLRAYPAILDWFARYMG